MSTLQFKRTARLAAPRPPGGEVHLERPSRQRAQRLDGARRERGVGDEVAVEDVEVEEVHARRLGTAQLVAEAGVVGVEECGADSDHGSLRR